MPSTLAAQCISVTWTQTSPSARGLKVLGVGVLCLPLLGPAGVRLALPTSAPIADWGAPDWSLAMLATPPTERLADASAGAKVALGFGAPVSLLQPSRFALTPAAATEVLRTYALLAGVHRPAPGWPLARDRSGGAGAVQVGDDRWPIGASHAAEIGQGARLSGVSPRYLFAVARSESRLSTYARARASSAAGLFQFVDQTWLRTLRRYGDRFGLEPEAAVIRIGADGRAEVANPIWRAEILALRYDPVVAARLAGALTRENASTLRLALGRSPTGGELYAAHLLGPAGALLLLSADRTAQAYPARLLLPAAAASNRALFYAGAAPRSVHEVAGLIADRASGGVDP